MVEINIKIIEELKEVLNIINTDLEIKKGLQNQKQISQEIENSHSIELSF